MINSPETETPLLPWYRQFWPWYLISIPAVAVLAGITMIVIATQNRDAMVVDNYYKAGLAINRTLEQQQVAAALGLSAQASIDSRTQMLTLRFPDAAPRGYDTLQLAFIHATLADQDHTIELKKTADAVYRGRLQDMHAGNWNLILQPPDALWRLDAHIRFPTQGWVLKPEL